MLFLNLRKILPKVWSVLLAVLFTASVFAQVALVYIHNVHLPVSDPLSAGGITLRLVGVKPSEKIRVLQNGYEIACFTEETIHVPVNRNTTIEIDGTAIESPFSVEIVSVDEGLKLSNSSNSINLSENIVILTKVFME